MPTKFNSFLFVLTLTLSSFFYIKKEQPTVFLIGDSTVRNGTHGRGDGGLWGWGSFFQNHFDTSKVTIANKAFGGTSSHSFYTKGFWAKVEPFIKKGDIVLIQFGHNDGSATTLKGIGNDSAEVTNPKTKTVDMAHSFGWNIRRYIQETKAKGGIPVVLSLVPRNMWKEGKLNRVASDYVLWDSLVAAQEQVHFINLNKIIADHYDEMGEAKVSNEFFTQKDHTHTIEAGAKFNAACVVEGLKKLKKNPLKKFVL